MKTAMVLFLNIAGIMTADAALIIYKVSEVDKVITGGKEAVVPSTGYSVTDLATGQQGGIGYFSLGGQKYYTISTNQTMQFWVSGKAKYTVYGRVFEGTNSQGYFRQTQSYGRGTNMLLDLGGATTRAPKLFSGTSRVIEYNPQTGYAATEGKLTVTFAEMRTKSANSTGKTLDQVIIDLALKLESEGYEFISQ